MTDKSRLWLEREVEAVPLVLEDEASLAGLTADQRRQLLNQVAYHLGAPPHEQVSITSLLSLKLQIDPGVTRPMSSKGISRWLWHASESLYGKHVLDMGTGCGIQGITCLLAGAQFVVLADVTNAAVECAGKNLLASGLQLRAQVLESDLFAALPKREFDVIIFAQPYFAGRPLRDYACTKGMLNDGTVLRRFFYDARPFLRPRGKIVMMDWSFAGDTNSAVRVGMANGYRVMELVEYVDPKGVQTGQFQVVVLE